MADKVGKYLESFGAYLKIDSVVKSDVTEEIRAHLEDKSHELMEFGFGEEEAAKAAAESFGSPELVARQLYQVHGQGTWQEAFFAALPHVLVALVFASYYWQNIICLSSVLAVVAFVAIYGWYHNKPMWLFPWLGYYLLPVILTGILLICLPQGWTWLGALAYIPLALFVIVSIVKQTANRDWLYVSLMLVPLPVVLAWLLALGPQNGFLAGNIQLAQLQVDAPWIVISFLVLAIATIISIRVRQRWCKAIALLIPPIGILTLVTLASRGNVSFWGWLILTLSLLALVSPAWLQFRS
jgi:hypothetical protein